MRYLGRGVTFDDISELNGISIESNRVFFHNFCKNFVQNNYQTNIHSPCNESELKEAESIYRNIGFTGCIGIII